MRLTRLAALAVAVAAIALPVSASAATNTLGMQVQSVAPDGTKVVGVLHCTSAEMAGKTVELTVGATVPAGVLSPGGFYGIVVETSSQTITNLVQPPCQPQLGPMPAPGSEPAPITPMPPPGGGCGGPPPGDAKTANTTAPATGPGEPGGPGCGPGGGDFERGFLNRVWKFEVEIDSLDADELDVTLNKVLNLTKRFADQDDDLVDQAAIVLIGKKTKIIEDGKRATRAELDNADLARVQGKLLPPKKWRKDEDDQETPTIRAKKVIIVK